MAQSVLTRTPLPLVRLVKRVPQVWVATLVMAAQVLQVAMHRAMPLLKLPLVPLVMMAKPVAVVAAVPTVAMPERAAV
jgi:hypothetical protein